MKRYKPVFIGLTFILAIFLFIWGYNFLNGKSIFSKQVKYFAVYKNVSGLNVANAVMINGLRIGQVSSIGFDPDMSGDVIVEIVLMQDFPVPRNTVAKIFSADLMGSKLIDLKLGDSQALAKSGDTLASMTEASLKDELNSQVEPIKAKAENLLSSIDSLVTAIQKVFNQDSRESLANSFANIGKTIDNLESTTSNIDMMVDKEVDRIASILQNIDSISYTLSQNRSNLAAIISNFEQFSDSLTKTNIAGTFNRANNSLAQLETILNQVNKGEGSLGMLMYNDTLYIEIEKSAEELNKLLKDLRENPKRYVSFSLF